MTVPQSLAPELPTPSLKRSCLRAIATASCLLGLLTAAACGSIEDSADVANLGPGTTTTNGTNTTSQARTPTARANDANDTKNTNDTDPSDVSAREQDRDDVTRSGSSTTRTRGGGAGRTRVSDIPSDADDIDAGTDAGDVDAGDIDAGELEVDAGDAGAAT